MEEIEHDHSQTTRGLKNMVVTLCDTSSFHLSSRDHEPLCEAFQAQEVFCAFSVCAQGCRAGCLRLASFPGSSPPLPPPAGEHLGDACGNCSSQNPDPQPHCFVLLEPASSTGQPGLWQSFPLAHVSESCSLFSPPQSPQECLL